MASSLACSYNQPISLDLNGVVTTHRPRRRITRVVQEADYHLH